MFKYNKNTPDGTRDILYSEAKLYSQITAKLSQVYENDGYMPVITPAIEYYDAFDYKGQSLAQERMYKLTDNNGRLIVMRADNTTPVARIIATKLQSVAPPYMLYYNQNVYRLNSDYSGTRSEVMQSGVELAGIGGEKCDLLCITTAIKALRSLGVNFKLEIGHIGFCEALIDEMNLTYEQKSIVREYINANNTVSLSFLKTESDFGKIKQLPRLYGEAEIFDRAAKLADGNIKAIKSLDNVRSIYNRLCEAGFGDDILVNIGIAHPIQYYTGVVFRGYIDGAGEPVLSGGRYDNLISEFDRSMPATGFGINVSIIVDALIKKDTYRMPNRHVSLLHFNITDYDEALIYCNANSNDKHIYRLSFADSENDTVEYAKSSASEALSYHHDGVTVLWQRKDGCNID